MGIIKTDDIIAYRLSEAQELVCRVCSTPDEIKGLKEVDDFIQESQRDDGELLFCDRCKELI